MTDDERIVEAMRDNDKGAMRAMLLGEHGPVSQKLFAEIAVALISELRAAEIIQPAPAPTRTLQ